MVGFKLGLWKTEHVHPAQMWPSREPAKPLNALGHNWYSGCWGWQCEHLWKHAQIYVLRIKGHEKEPSVNWVRKIGLIFQNPERECNWLFWRYLYQWEETREVVGLMNLEKSLQAGIYVINNILYQETVKLHIKAGFKACWGCEERGRTLACGWEDCLCH